MVRQAALCSGRRGEASSTSSPTFSCLPSGRSSRLIPLLYSLLMSASLDNFRSLTAHWPACLILLHPAPPLLRALPVKLLSLTLSRASLEWPQSMSAASSLSLSQYVPRVLSEWAHRPSHCLLLVSAYRPPTRAPRAVASPSPKAHQAISYRAPLALHAALCCHSLVKCFSWFPHGTQA